MAVYFGLGQIRRLGPETFIDGVLKTPSGKTTYLEGNFDASDATITGLVISDVILVNPVLEDAVLFGTTTLFDQHLVGGSTIEIEAGETVTAIGGGTFDLSNWTLILPPPTFNDVTLLGTTTLNNVLWDGNSLATVSAGNTLLFDGGGLVDFSGVDVSLPASVYEDVTLTGVTTITEFAITPGITLTPVTANPNPVQPNTTIWSDVTLGGAIKYGPNLLLRASSSPTTSNDLAVFSNTTGAIASSTVSLVAAHLRRPLYIGDGMPPFAGDITALDVQATCDGRVYMVISNNGPGAASSAIQFSDSSTDRWRMGNGVNGDGSDSDFAIYNYGRSANAMIIARATNTVTLEDTIKAKHFEIDIVTDISGPARTIWLSTLDDVRPRWGQTNELALITDIPSPPLPDTEPVVIPPGFWSSNVTATGNIMAWFTKITNTNIIRVQFTGPDMTLNSGEFFGVGIATIAPTFRSGIPSDIYFGVCCPARIICVAEYEGLGFFKVTRPSGVWSGEPIQPQMLNFTYNLNSDPPT